MDYRPRPAEVATPKKKSARNFYSPGPILSMYPLDTEPQMTPLDTIPGNMTQSLVTPEFLAELHEGGNLPASLTPADVREAASLTSRTTWTRLCAASLGRSLWSRMGSAGPLLVIRSA
jgi:hypothetical protein